MIKVFGSAFKLIADLIRLGICAAILLLTLIQVAGLLGYWFVLLDSVNHFQPFWMVGSLFLFTAVLMFFVVGKIRNLLIGILACCFSAGLLLTGPDLIKKIYCPPDIGNAFQNSIKSNDIQSLGCKRSANRNEGLYF